MAGHEASPEIRVAVASSDGAYVNAHFGRASRFYVYRVAGKIGRFVELRKNDPACGSAGHDEDMLERAVSRISDCRAVVVSRIGPGAEAALLERGIRSFVLPMFIEDALARVWAEVSVG